MKKHFFLILILIGLSCKHSPKKGPILKNTNLNELFEVVDLNGVSINKKSFKGKKVLVNYWATWCAPCKDEMPSLQSLKEKLDNNNYLFVLISSESIQEISAFKAQHNYDFLFYKSEKSMISRGIYVLPTTILYNSQGNLVDKITGSIQWDELKMIEKLKNIQ